MANIRADSEDQHILPVVDEHDNSVHYSGEDEHNHAKELDNKAKEVPRFVIAAELESFKYIYSFALLIFSIVIVMGGIFQRQTLGVEQDGGPPALAC